MGYADTDSDDGLPVWRSPSPTDDVDPSPVAPPWKLRTEWTESCPPSITIIEAIADATGTPPTDLEPLDRTVDLEALDALLTASDPDSIIKISFPVATAAVTVEVIVDSAGWIEVSIGDLTAD